MAELNTDVHIFLSSTFIDLKELREKIANRLRDVFGAHLLIMETSGSDDAPPVISSVRRVREADIFIGIYARRYGYIDAASGRSITELELREAERSLSAGTLTAILLYWLEDNASWPTDLCETGLAAVAKLAALREHCRQHTYTPFSDSSDLPFLIIRDVLTKLRSRMTEPYFRTRKLALPPDRKLQHPIGMEFLTSADRRHLFGRGPRTKELLGVVTDNAITLLLGNSGSGKTSLIHAGLIPEAAGADWFTVYTRPLGLPRTDVVSALLSTVFEGPHSYRGALLGPLENAAAALAPKRILLIIDQFEDTLTSRDEGEVERLVEDLRIIRSTNSSSFRVLVSYRADLEARLGRFWQKISGSPMGLPRVYIAGIGANEAALSIESACTDLGVELALTDNEKTLLKKDLQVFSSRQDENGGVYPPYIQMLIDHIWRHAKAHLGVYRFKDYLEAGAMDGVTAGYLARQLEYAHDSSGQLKAVLVSLVRSYGVKAQKSLAEIAADTRVSETECEVALEKLIDLRLVRHIADLYEVAHDFLAKQVSEKLVDSEEREFKRLRELLSSKSATFSTTGSTLTVEELLLLFKYKERILLSDGEFRLLLASWARGEGPGLFLLVGSNPSRLTELVRVEETTENFRGRDRDQYEHRAMLVLLRRKAENTPLSAEEWVLFRRYRLGMELVQMINASPLECPDRLLLWALRHRRPILRDTAFKAVRRKVSEGRWNWIGLLAKSESARIRFCYQQIVIDRAVPLFPLKLTAASSRLLQEFSFLQQIDRAETDTECTRLLKSFKKFRPRAWAWSFASAIAWRYHYRSSLRVKLRNLQARAVVRVATFLNSLHPNLDVRDFRALLDDYISWNQKEASVTEDRNPRLRKVYEHRASALAETILRISTHQSAEPLRAVLPEITLTPSAQYIARALVGVGDTSDIVAIINKVAQVEYPIQYWFQIEIGQIVEKRMTDLKGSMPAELLRITEREDFWTDPRSKSLRLAHTSPRPLRSLYNRALYVRMVAHALIGASGQENFELLRALTLHQFRLIARSAAVRLVNEGGDSGIKMLQSVVAEAIDRHRAEALGLAVRDAEIQVLGIVSSQVHEP